jgi:ADP-heptose:LPS heptosyltransferase
MGDTLLLTSPLHALRNQFPDFHVSILLDPRFAACMDGNPDVDDVLTTGESKWATIRDLTGRRFDAVVNLHGGPTSLAYSIAAGRRRAGVEGYQFQRLYSTLAPKNLDRRHTVKATMALFAALGLDPVEPGPLHYAHHADDAEWVRASVGSGRYVVIHPAAVMKTKRWSEEGFAAVGERLTREGYRIVLTCGPGEERVLTATAARLPDSLILVGLTIPRLAELIRGADLYIGNDSGPMHLAAAVGTPIIAPWGSSDAVRWHPWHVPHTVVQNPFECNPCPGYKCLVASSPLCIESVTPAQVSDRAVAMIETLRQENPSRQAAHE